MTLQSSAPISAQDINVELGRSATAAFDINGSDERALAGVASGAISFSDFLGKSSVPDIAIVDSFAINATGSWSKTGVDFGADFTGRRIVCIAWGSNGSTENPASAAISSIGGVTAVQRNDTSSAFNGSGALGIATADPTGTSGTISGNSGSTLTSLTVVVIAVETTSNTPDDYGLTNDAVSHPLSSITGQANGVFIAAFLRGSGASGTMEFTGTAGITKQSDDSASSLYGWATDVSTGAKSVSYSGGGTANAVGVAVAFHAS